eukprot:3925660-Rhodomonas_salina.1
MQQKIKRLRAINLTLQHTGELEEVRNAQRQRVQALVNRANGDSEFALKLFYQLQTQLGDSDDSDSDSRVDTPPFLQGVGPRRPP